MLFNSDRPFSLEYWVSQWQHQASTLIPETQGMGLTLSWITKAHCPLLNGAAQGPTRRKAVFPRSPKSAVFPQIDSIPRK